MLRALRSAGQVTDVTLAPLDAGQSAELAAEVRGTAARPRGGGPAVRRDRGLSAVRHRIGPGVPAGQPRRRRTTAAALDRCIVRPAAPASVRPHSVPQTLAPEPVPPHRRCPPLTRGPRPAPCWPTGYAQAEPGRAREVAELAAVIGRDFTLELLTEASDLDEDSVIGAVDELWRRRIIREHPPASYDFVHDLLPRHRLRRASARRGAPPAPPRGPGAGADPRRRPAPPPRPWPTTTSGPAARPARYRITCAPPRSPPGCSPTRRPSATTGGPPSCCGKPRRARNATPASWPSCWPWPPRSTRSTGTRRASCKRSWSAPATWPSGWATPGCS